MGWLRCQEAISGAHGRELESTVFSLCRFAKRIRGRIVAVPGLIRDMARPNIKRLEPSAGEAPIPCLGSPSRQIVSSSGLFQPTFRVFSSMSMQLTPLPFLFFISFLFFKYWID